MPCTLAHMQPAFSPIKSGSIRLRSGAAITQLRVPLGPGGIARHAYSLQGYKVFGGSRAPGVTPGNGRRSSRKSAQKHKLCTIHDRHAIFSTNAAMPTRSNSDHLRRYGPARREFIASFQLTLRASRICTDNSCRPSIERVSSQRPGKGGPALTRAG